MKKSILIVDDEASIIETYKDILELLDFNVFTANNPYKALQIVNNNDNIIHLAILDYNLPQMTGIQLGHLIKKSNDSIKIMFFSGNPDINGLVCDIKYETCMVMTKPISIENYIQAVNAVLDEPMKELSKDRVKIELKNQVN